MSDYVDDWFAERGMTLTPSGELAVVAAGALFMLSLLVVQGWAVSLLFAWVVVGG